MSGGHGGSDGAYVHGHSRVHGLPADGKILGLVLTVLIVVATPAGMAYAAAYAAYAVLLALVVRAARLSAALVARRAVVEVPFLVFALLLPFVGSGERVIVGPLSLSVAGLAGGATLAVKATFGVVAAVVLAATTTPRDLLVGLERLRMPAAVIAILGFMIRYLGVLTNDFTRMRIARESRCAPGGTVGQLAAVAGGAGSLFVRSYERGERVHVAMLARGYDGRMPDLSALRPASVSASAARTLRTRGLLVCGIVPALAACCLALTWVVASGVTR